MGGGKKADYSNYYNYYKQGGKRNRELPGYAGYGGYGGYKASKLFGRSQLHCALCIVVTHIIAIPKQNTMIIGSFLSAPRKRALLSIFRQKEKEIITTSQVKGNPLPSQAKGKVITMGRSRRQKKLSHTFTNPTAGRRARRARNVYDLHKSVHVLTTIRCLHIFTS
jgi:hypothetical protein